MVDINSIVNQGIRVAKQIGPIAAGIGAFRAPTLAKLSTFDKGLAAIQAVAAAAPNQMRRGSETGQSVAVSISETPPRETAMSSEMGILPAAFRSPPMSYGGGMSPVQLGLPAIIGGGGAMISGGRTLGALLGLGGAAAAIAPMIIDPITGQEKTLRVTRRLRSNVKKAVEMFGVEFVAEQMGTDVEVIFYILTKKMRNDGPAVTKAALRKTRQTMRKLDAMCDMRDKMRPPARRATRARTTSKVMQIKN
tara:strand:+ start:392 stop:1141 length:750 start_codon:yes stop_codon:yes gene_type:complete